MFLCCCFQKEHSKNINVGFSMAVDSSHADYSLFKQSDESKSFYTGKTSNSSILGHYNNSKNKNSPQKKFDNYPINTLFLLGATNKMLCKVTERVLENGEKSLINYVSKKILNGSILDVIGQEFSGLIKLSTTCNEIHTISPFKPKGTHIPHNIKIYKHLEEIQTSNAKIDVVLFDLRTYGLNLFPEIHGENIFDVIIASFQFSTNIILLTSPEIFLNDLSDLFSVVPASSLTNDGRFSVEIEKIFYANDKQPAIYLVYFGITSITKENEINFFRDNYFSRLDVDAFNSKVKPLLSTSGTKDFLKNILKFQRMNESSDESELIRYLNENLTTKQSVSVRGREKSVPYKTEIKESLEVRKEILQKKATPTITQNSDLKGIVRAKSMERLQSDEEQKGASRGEENNSDDVKEVKYVHKPNYNDENSVYSYSSNFIKDFVSSAENSHKEKIYSNLDQTQINLIRKQTIISKLNNVFYEVHNQIAFSN